MITGAPAGQCTAVVAVGIDTADVRQVHESLERYGERYLRFLLTGAEREELLARTGTLPAGSGVPDATAREVATRWAAKEAVTKVLAPSPDDPWPWTHVEVLGLADRPAVTLSGRPRELAEQAGIATVVVDTAAPSTGPHVTVTATGLGPARPRAEQNTRE